MRNASDNFTKCCIAEWRVGERGRLLLLSSANFCIRRYMMVVSMWDTWSRTGSLFGTVDKRRLQHEIDTHKLFLLTSFQREATSGEIGVAEELTKLAEATPFEEQQRQVQEQVHGQIKKLSTVLDSILLKDPLPEIPSPPSEKKRPSGLFFALGRQPEPEAPPRANAIETKPLTREQVASAFREHTGFTLCLQRSGIPHEEAGTGLFIKGRAEPGTVVSMYPGVVYSPSQYRYIPGYPKVDVDNGYLISRYDGLVIDGKPWGKGDDIREWWDGHNGISFEQAAELTGPARQSLPSFWQFVGGGKVMQGPLEGAELERRSPIALGHFANHPPEGVHPNVMICPYTFSISGQQSMRAYIPNVMFGNDEEFDMQRRGPLWINEGKKERPEDPADTRLSTVERSEQPITLISDVHTLVLVTTREVDNEELFLNYRLSSYIQQPEWYHPVNVEEEKRRWD
ncbi:uncharacterized protein [Physcomitrium patens]|uniref:SET domain-containing protein n=1 Tax=Physcomitrium patens TaxID=3218 RepID=A0A2K1JXW8_PHYPA|nr:uncharacterized protein LOC112288020 isoform X1 [Physcomitrium patens]PNR46367.1 hypothetical protein PHYPA_013486 [Physcomitrium patens]|eukprot:XP_024387535.1 uncharacterized protein LOC112288020 isoform X1 [Physcomitrella patens]